MSYTVLRISDGQHLFPFLYDGNNIYCPDYNPSAYGNHPQYCFSIANTPISTPRTTIFDASEFLGCAPFRHEGYSYSQYIVVGIPGNGRYINLQAWKDGEPDPNYTSVQSAIMMDTDQFAINVGVNRYGIYIAGTKASMTSMLRQCYGYPTSNVVIEAEVGVMDENDVYWQNANYSSKGGSDFCFALTRWPYTTNQQWQNDLRIVGIMHITITHPNGERMHINLRSKPFKLTEQVFAELLCVSENKHTILGFENMVVNKPRIINKDIVQVVEMTSQTDSKSNIVQPVFFRTRELANIIVHPEVTENICINLDAYKAQATRFFIKIEGVTFPEIGRVESGAIFKVQGNLLPGKVAGGVYYILDQDLNLITTGKYTYEA